jgi:Domain of unknown function (DUF4132)
VVLKDIAQVGALHPAKLSPELRAVWGELLSDYEIFQPFRQIDRTVHTLDPTEQTQNILTRFQNTSVSGMIAIAILKKAHWTTFHNEAKGIQGYYKAFPYAGVTAVLESPISAYVDLATLDRCYFVSGLFSETTLDADNAGLLGNIDPVVISEVLRLLGAIVTASKDR